MPEPQRLALSQAWRDEVFKICKRTWSNDACNSPPSAVTDSERADYCADCGRIAAMAEQDALDAYLPTCVQNAVAACYTLNPNCDAVVPDGLGHRPRPRVSDCARQCQDRVNAKMREPANAARCRAGHPSLGTGSSGGAFCNDGSPANCTGRGCCSHHGGVAHLRPPSPPRLNQTSSFA
jgi:hypothetical protein